MANVVYIVMDLNDGTPLWVFHDKAHADTYRLLIKQQFPETSIVECDVD